MRECVEQERALVRAADERRVGGQREAGRERKANDLRAGERSPRDRVRLHGHVEPLEVERTHRLEHVPAARRREDPHDVTGDDRCALGDPAQSRRFDHGRSEVVVVFGLDLPERDPDAHEERFGHTPVPGIEALLHLDGRVDGRARRVANTTMNPSPRFFTSRPACFASASRTSAKYSRRTASF